MLCTPTSNALFFNILEDISKEIWEDLSIDNNYLQLPYLHSLQKNHPNISFYYIVLKNKQQKAIALATVQIVDFYIDSLKSDYKGIAENIKKFGKKLHLLKNEEKLRILICGNPFISGEYGVTLTQNENKKQIVNQITKAISELVESKKSLKKTVDVFLIKDFLNRSLSIANTLKNYNYHPFSVEPNMVLEIRKDWISFKDYLAAFKTKFRVKAKRALTLSESLKVVIITERNFSSYSESIDNLYHSVADSSSFNLVQFNTRTYKDFLENFKDNYILQSYWLEGKMVGFISGLIQKKTLDAHFVGIDYNYNKSHAIYQRMLYDYVKFGIERKVDAINFGRTASEIKSSVGAIPQELTMYVRHKKTIPNQLLKLFLQKIEPIPFQQKKPFKQLVK